MAVALRLRGAQELAVSSALALAFEHGGAPPAAAAASLAHLLARTSATATTAVSAAYGSAVLEVLRNSTAAAAALAEGLTSNDAALEEGCMQALAAVRRHSGCRELRRLLEGAKLAALAHPPGCFRLGPIPVGTSTRGAPTICTTTICTHLHRSLLRPSPTQTLAAKRRRWTVQSTWDASMRSPRTLLQRAQQPARRGGGAAVVARESGLEAAVRRRPDWWRQVHVATHVHHMPLHDS